MIFVIVLLKHFGDKGCKTGAHMCLCIHGYMNVRSRKREVLKTWNSVLELLELEKVSCCPKAALFFV